MKYPDNEELCALYIKTVNDFSLFNIYNFGEFIQAP